MEARPVGDDGLEMDPSERLGNGFVGTVAGGAQALLAECAVERVAPSGFEAVDLHIRFLSRLKVGPAARPGPLLRRQRRPWSPSPSTWWTREPTRPWSPTWRSWPARPVAGGSAGG